MAQSRSEILQGTLDLMVLKALDALGPLHGYGIARRLEQISEEVLKLNEGTVYASLLRLVQNGWIAAKWGVSENNRKAKFYSITKAGRKQLAREAQNWERISAVVGRLLAFATGDRPCAPFFRDCTVYSPGTRTSTRNSTLTSLCSPSGLYAWE